MHLIDILMKKTKSSQILSVYFSFLFSCFLFIFQCSFANFTLNSGKRQERGRVSNRCFSMKNYTTVIFVLYLFIFPITVNILQLIYLIVLMKKTKGSQILFVSLSLFFYF
jgi:hypothetical protein